MIQYIKYSCHLPYYGDQQQQSNNQAAPPKLFHEELLTEWINALTRKNTHDQIMFKDMLLRNSWFFFELLFKSLGIYLNLKTNCLSKTNQMSNYKYNLLSHSNQTLQTYCSRQLSPRFLGELERLIKLVISEIIAIQTGQISRVSQSMRSCNQLQINFDSLKQFEMHTNLVNCWLAFFVQDMFSLIDRGFLFKLVDYYIKETNKSVSSLNSQLKNLQKSASTKQNQLKFCIYNTIRVYNSIQLDFLRILSSYEHFLALNLPVFPDLNEMMDKIKKPPNSFDQQKPTKLIIESKEYFHRHYLIGLICRQV